MKKNNPKKLFLGKVKIADLSKFKLVNSKGGLICETSIEDTSCTNSTQVLSIYYC